MKNEKTIIDLRDLWGIFIDRLWVILTAAVIFAGAAVLFNYVTYVPEYSSTATLYILRQDNETINNSDFTLALNVVNDCDILLKSHSVLDEVIDELGLDTSFRSLRSKISTNNPTSSRILEVTVRADTPAQAQMIVDKICEIGQEKITDAMGFQQVNFYEHGTLNTNPSNKTSLIKLLFVGIVAAVAIYAIYVVVFIFDDRIRTEEDVEKYLGLSILGDIPNADDNKSGKKGYKYYGYGAKKKEAVKGKGDK